MAAKKNRTEPKISAILMAAGFSRRMGADKLFMRYQNKTLIEHALALLDELPVYEKILVTTAGRLEKLTLPPAVTAVINHNPEAGQSESLRLGLGKATGQWYLFLNADQPKLKASALLPMLDLAKDNPEKIIYPASNGSCFSPVLFHEIFRPKLLSITGDTGGRQLRTANASACVPFIAANPDEFMDVDTPGAFSFI